MREVTLKFLDGREGTKEIPDNISQFVLNSLEPELYTLVSKIPPEKQGDLMVRLSGGKFFEVSKENNNIYIERAAH